MLELCIGIILKVFLMLVRLSRRFYYHIIKLCNELCLLVPNFNMMIKTYKPPDSDAEPDSLN